MGISCEKGCRSNNATPIHIEQCIYTQIVPLPKIPSLSSARIYQFLMSIYELDGKQEELSRHMEGRVSLIKL